MYEVKGSFRLGEAYQDFCIKVEAKNESNAINKAYAKLGSNHKCKRRFVNIEGVKVVKQ